VLLLVLLKNHGNPFDGVACRFGSWILRR